jgi:hypothetical protein
LLMSRSTTVALPARVARTRLSPLGMAPVQDATELVVPPGVAVGTAVAAAVGDGGGAVDGVTVACGDGLGLVLPSPGAVQAPRRISTANPAADLPTPLRSTGDNLT